MTEPTPRGSATWTLRRRIVGVFGGLAASLAILLAVLIVATIQFGNAGNAVVYRWQPVVLYSQRVLTDLVDQETGLRGYALSSDPQFLQPYREYRRAQTADTAHLRSLIGTDSDLQKGLTALTRAADTWQRAIAEPALTGIRAGDPAALTLVESLRAKQYFDAIRSRAATLGDLAQARSRQARITRSDAGIAFVVSLSLAAAVVLGIGVFLWRGLHRWVLSPVDRLAAQTRDVAGGATFQEISPTGPAEFTALGSDVEAMRLQIATELARAEAITEELRQQGDELARSNADLQQFAYVASHDLSEPLRKVANFCQLLERQYADQLDDRAREYIGYAVDGARRMQRLIADLLRLSRVGRSTEQFDAVDLDAALDVALATLAEPIARAGAQVERATPLPTVFGDQPLLISLFENLVGNAVKYRRADVAPVVRISAERFGDPAMWSFTVADNGIGIEQQYAERIFVVFQRLHLRDSYGGTGIGLALCRKIVESHGGRIWLADVESAEPGATFTFTLPEGGVRAEPRS